MGIIRKIQRKVNYYYREIIACEQYPMLTSTNRKEWQEKGALGLVFMMHHIMNKNPNGIPTNEDLKVSPEFLDKIICRYRKQGFVFISLAELYEIITKEKTCRQPFVVFTIDDGYLDNYTTALPVFERQNVPFAIFVATDFIDKKAILWWDCLEDLIMTNDSIVTNDGICYPCKTFQQRWDTFRFLRERILNLDQQNLEFELNKTFANYRINWREPILQKGMSWDQVKELANHPLCTIGGHSVSHPALSSLNDLNVYKEIKEGKERIEEMINRPIYYFAYPYGTPNEVGNREYEIVEKLGFKLAFCAHGGCITNNNTSNSRRLTRVYLHQS